MILIIPADTPELQTIRRFGGSSTDAPNAVRFLKYPNFSKYLRQLGNAEECLDLDIEAVCMTKDLADQVMAHRLTVPKPTQLYAARLKLDAVTMGLERRWFKRLCNHRRHEVASMHLFTDASPVTGAEIQGTILETFFKKKGDIITIIMLGVYMKYGGCRAVDKVVAFLWALHLIAGIDYDDLCWIIGMISSLTTDHGTEIGLVDVPDILRPWLRRLGGTPMDDLAGAIDFSTRLFKYAMRIPGRSHMWANIMKYACNRLAN